MNSKTATDALITSWRLRSLLKLFGRFCLDQGACGDGACQVPRLAGAGPGRYVSTDRIYSFGLTIRRVTAGAICSGALLLAWGVSFAQEGPIAALEKKYTITQTTLNRDQIADPGVVMEVEAHGINAQPWGAMMTFDNPVVDGKVQQRSSGISGLRMLGSGMKNLHILEPGGQGVYHQA